MGLVKNTSAFIHKSAVAQIIVLFRTLQMSKYFLLVYIIITWINVLSAHCSKNPYIHAYSVKDGLPGMFIYDLHIDGNGYLYLGTDKGLCKYNGVEFTLYPFADNSITSVSSIRESSSGEIYCRSFTNQIFHLSADTLYPILSHTNKAGSGERLAEFQVYSDSLIICYTKELHVVSPHTGKGRILFFNSLNPFDEFTDVLFDHDTLWVGSINTIYKFHSGQLLGTLSAVQGEKYLTKHKGQLIYVNRNNKKGLFDLNGKNLMAELGNNLNPIYTRSIGDKLWVCSNEGLVSQNDGLTLLADKKISDIVEDHQGNTWISSAGYGLYLLSDLALSHFKHNSSVDEILLRITASQDRLFVSSNRGKIHQYNPEGKYIGSLSISQASEINALIYDEKGSRLYSSYGIYEIDGNASKQVYNTYIGNSLRLDPFGQLLISYHAGSGILKWNGRHEPKALKLPWLETDIYFKDSILFLGDKKRSRCAIYSNLYKGYLVGFFDNLSLVQAQGKSSILNPDGNAIRVNDMIEIDNTLYLGTTNDGVWSVDKKGWRHLYDGNGLPHNHVKRIKEEKNGVWILTEQGIAFINHNGEIDIVDPRLRLNILQLNDIHPWRDNLWLASSEGLLSYPIKNIFDDRALPKADIEIRHSDGKLLLHNGVYDYNANSITVKLNSAMLGSYGQHRYRYRLKGLDSGWRETPAQSNTISFGALPPGKYEFQAYISNFGQLSEVSAFSFGIDSPWWLEWWFIIFQIILFGGLVYVSFIMMSLRYKKKQNQREKLFRSQLTALRAQMNPHFLYNVLNSVQGMIYSNKKVEAGDYLGKFSDLMRKILDTSDKQSISLQHEIEMLNLYLELESMRFDGELHYQLNLEIGVEAFEIMVPTMVLQPFVENAIKHGLLHKKGSKQLTIEIAYTKSPFPEVQVIINDNGIGRTASRQIQALKEKKSASFATHAINSRIELLNKARERPISIQIEDKLYEAGISAGTRVTIRIPIENHERD